MCICSRALGKEGVLTRDALVVHTGMVGMKQGREACDQDGARNQRAHMLEPQVLSRDNYRDCKFSPGARAKQGRMDRWTETTAGEVPWGCPLSSAGRAWFY